MRPALTMHRIRCMGMLFVLGVVIAFAMVIWLFVHAVTSDPSPREHRWLVVVPIVILAGWIIEQLIMG